MPIPPSSFTSFAMSVTGSLMTGVTGIFLSRQADMNFHLSSRSKSLLFVARAVIDASRQLSCQSWIQSVGASSERRKHSAADSSIPRSLRHHEPQNATVGMTKRMAATAEARDRAQNDSGTPYTPVGTVTLRRFVSISCWKVPAL
ncbi:unnamed protein product [Prorocentrum cordatum]|uniref:Uncharacterized protein n=1 Tax=Prorocentrum cordatum TaxID=2364126 RepID=A0ABN9T6V7_9DINO|nr:unnamed protein product [Polarella glacialis]